VDDGGEINATAVMQVDHDSFLDLLEQAGAPPFVVAAVAGLPGGVASGQIRPGARPGELPEDALRDGTLVDGWAASGGCGGGWRDEGLDDLPLFVREAHWEPPGFRI
jgi:hypothetical protein